MKCVKSFLMSLLGKTSQQAEEECKVNFQLGEDSDEEAGTEERGVQTEPIDSSEEHIYSSNVRSLEECLAIFKSDVGDCIWSCLHMCIYNALTLVDRLNMLF